LDVVSCGFGAIILLLVIVKVAEPRVLEQLSVDLTGLVQRLEAELVELRGEVLVTDSELEQRRAELEQGLARLARLEGELSAVQGRYTSSRHELDVQATVADRLATARQQLDEELRRLQGPAYRRPRSDATVGGIPVDSEYIVFIIDTSGSMQRGAWPLVVRKVTEVLQLYPQVKGIQVLNDMGDYMFSQYAGRWIPDTPVRREAITRRLAGWAPFSNSSPVEGIETAIARFHAEDKRVSLYVFGDDFARGSIQAVVDTVERLNRADASGRRRVRIHAVGFPVLFAYGGLNDNVVRFAALMRRLAEDNNGSFVGLNALR
ncbi:MAG TPA: VWA domain-containing protein, partial [Gammaproteobacteria bacterium]